MYAILGGCAISDVNQAEKDAKNPPLYKKVFNGHQ